MFDGRRRLTRWRLFRASILFALPLVLLDGCARHRIAANGSRSNPIPVVGTEHITWSLLVLSWHKPENYQYFAYVDGKRVPLSNALCERADVMTYSCRASLPPLKSGRHEIQVVTLDTQDGTESGRSSTVVVVVTPEKSTNR
jgi:hypothetical protein